MHLSLSSPTAATATCNHGYSYWEKCFVAKLPACSLFTITTSKSLLDATDELGSGGFTTILQNQLFRYDDKDDDDDDAPNQLSVYSMFWKHKYGNGN